jgi:iron complex transport system substrate-binding protein
VVLDEVQLVNAFSSGSALGTLWALENTVPLFAESL